MLRTLPIALLLLVGCEKPPPPTYPVEGKVEFLGKAPEGFIVEFASQEEATKGMNAQGKVEADGTFKLKTNVKGKDKDGAVAGLHKVVVVPPPASSGGPEILPVPFRYADYGSSGLTFEVKPDGSNSYKIKLDE